MKNTNFTTRESWFIIIGFIGWLMEIIRFFYYLKIKIQKFINRFRKVDLIINNQTETHSLAEINELIEEMKQKKLNKIYHDQEL
ncbi:MAG: hypothetical protein AD073_000316 [Mycoplasmataceae bacterium]|nr:MAG: hypothetical protein AD073_000316 [Mycoplasmataceae bacterium]